jgi:uncharacterized repeat protein (TIGR03803 family)
MPARLEREANVGTFSLSKTLCIAFVFCAATAIASPAQTFSTLHRFQGYPTEGSFSWAALVQGTDGNFYGTTTSGGTNCSTNMGCGTVFKITSSGTLDTLYSFCPEPNCPDGVLPTAALVQGSDGNFYATTIAGGASCPPVGCGTVFKITPSGTLTTLHRFMSTDGAEPSAGLVQATDGNFYGTTDSGGNNTDSGTIFKITPGGTLTTLYSFCSQPNCADGAVPGVGLFQAADGTFYGTTVYGGASGYGTVFKITPAGRLTTLYSFCAQTGCPDGQYPYSGLVQATDGNFYGTTSEGGGLGGSGTVFKITPSGTLTTLYSFCSQPNCADGGIPMAGLVQASDGNFYGTTIYGGANGYAGTVFKITPSGTLTTLYSFCSQANCSDGATPHAGLVQGTDGSFYGTTYGGGASGYGTVFSLSVGLAPFVETQPTSGKTGDPVVILGTNLTGATGVTFNGTPAVFNLVSPTEITTNVPSGATTGFVQVTGTPSGTLTSNTTFRITSPVQFVPVTPCRLLDTRGSSPIQGGTFESFNLPQLAQQSPGCSGLDLSPAAAYSLNVTVVPRGPLGYLTLWPTGEIMPYISTMNSYDGRIKANAAIVPAGSNSVSVYVTDTTDVILDIDGYFTTPSQQTVQFYPLTPCRVADTRNSTDFAQGLGAPYLMGGKERDFPVLDASMNKVPCNIPNSAQAYSLNFTAVPHGSLGYLTVWPFGQPQPVVSTLNAYGGQVTANAAIVPAGKDGKISAYAYNDTDLLIDINGYFAPPGQGGLSLYPVVPCRVLDTRQGNGAFNGTLSPPVDLVNSPCAVPSAAQAYVLNATVVPTGEMGYLTLWPDGQMLPGVSTLNAYDGAVTSNMAIVTGVQGKIDAYADKDTSPTDLILDISSYFAP